MNGLCCAVYQKSYRQSSFLQAHVAAFIAQNCPQSRCKGTQGGAKQNPALAGYVGYLLKPVEDYRRSREYLLPYRHDGNEGYEGYRQHYGSFSPLSHEASVCCAEHIEDLHTEDGGSH